MKQKKPFDTFRIVLRGVRIPWLLVLISLTASSLTANAMVKSATITAQVVDASGNLKTSEVISYIVYTLGGGLLSVLGTYTNSLMTEKINLGVREKLWAKMLRIPLSFYDKESGETLVSRVTNDCDRASGFMGVVIMLISSLYGLVLAIQSMYSFSATLTLWCLVLVPVISIGVSLSGRLVFRMISNYYAARSQVTTYLLERVKNLRLVRSSNMEENETREGKYQFRNLFRTCIRYTLSDSLMTSFMGLTPIGLIIITFIIGGIKIASGELTPGVVIGFFGVSGMASVRISVLITVYGNYAETSGVVQKISTVLNAEEESNEGRPMDLPDADIVLENVQFAYGDKPVLKGVSCVIPKKRITAIIGNNGAGKSTLFKLLEKMYEPSSGRILFGDVPLATFDPVAWRRAFALVSQDRPLLSGTIRENMTYGCNRSVSDEELRGAAKQANILELIESLPDGFDTHVEPGGSNFSGGQRQCIAIARAIMRNPDYLLLDEATSNMDAQSERLVSEALANLMRGRTTIMIAHNLSAISCADYIIVLQDGKVDACGTPEEAAKASVIFRDFVKSQTATALCQSAEAMTGE